jgi:hypothetical protein
MVRTGLRTAADQRRRRQLANRSLWLVGFIVYLASQEFVAKELADVGARVPIYVVTFVVAVVFYCWTLHVLLLGGSAGESCSRADSPPR